MKIDPKEFERAVRELVASSPGYVYQHVLRSGCISGCVYVVEKTDGYAGSCLIGQALIRAGVPGEKLLAWNNSGIHTLNQRLGLELPAVLLDWAELGQKHQDGRKPWGVALELADEGVSIE